MEDTGCEVVVVYDEENAEFFGRVTGTSGRFTFIGNTPAEVKKEFRVSFDDYLQLCIERGLKPDESFSGGRKPKSSPMCIKPLTPLLRRAGSP